MDLQALRAPFLKGIFAEPQKGCDRIGDRIGESERGVLPLSRYLSQNSSHFFVQKLI
jgi:hypothetical protein